MSPTRRRRLRFTNLEDAVADARKLLSSGYTQAGNWSLAQVLGHCNDWLCYPMDGYPRPPLPLIPMMWLAKHTVGIRMRRKILQTGKMKSGAPTMPQTVKKPNFADDASMLERLAENVRRFEQFTGQLHASPLFGAMTKAEHQQLQIIHLQHHLSFLAPKSDV